MMTIVDILQRVCHTSERTYEGIIYTLSDIRYPEYNGVKILAKLENGKYKFEYIEKE